MMNKEEMMLNKIEFKKLLNVEDVLRLAKARTETLLDQHPTWDWMRESLVDIERAEKDLQDVEKFLQERYMLKYQNDKGWISQPELKELE